MEETYYSGRNSLKEKIEIWDNAERAKDLISVFWIFIGFSAIALISGYFELRLYENLKNEGFPDPGKVKANDIRQLVVGIIQFAVYLITVVVFLNWFRRAYGNLHRLGIEYLRQSESMAVWSWFIPIVNLFRPVQIMYEIWTETQWQIKQKDASYRIKKGNLLLTIWWTLFILSHLAGRIALRAAFKEDTVNHLIEGSMASLISDALQILEALLVIIIVSGISKMETKLAGVVKKSGGNIIVK